LEERKPPPTPPKGERVKVVATVGQGEMVFMVFKGEFIDKNTI